MNRGVLQSSPVQQMMTGNPNLWNININNMPPQAPPFLSTPSNFPIPYAPTSSSFPFPWHENQELPESWSQLLMSGMVDAEDKAVMGQFHTKKLENWEDQMLISQASNASLIEVKQEDSVNSYVYGHRNEELQSSTPSWSPKSCVTSYSSNMLDFSNNKTDARHPPPDRSYECNSSGAGGALKKARVQPSATTQSTFKVRKEKLGDRITALHQLVSPFGKTDTASVLFEAIAYIGFLHSQIEVLSSPYLRGGSGNTGQQQHSVQGEKNCIFPEDPGQLLNENCLKRKAAGEPDTQEEPENSLRSRGLCLVPVSCTLQVGRENGADYWAPPLGGGFR
ncbi:transcription factor bHLH68 [Cajanus cajan]|uniref:Transcription factor bHLH68 n=1 Tax=Cajanus cajan TaxID=3821 RepID=A0A151TIS0_CAJCA|nr:transcription factor bHLH68 [Cajanus cajan]KYP66955.1 Transcription factor bHLH68 [Cajanus cajan]